MEQLATHVWPDTAALDAAGGLLIGGCPVADLAHQFGTPLYILDLATVQATAAQFRTALVAAYPGPTTVHYASKALLNTAVAQIMADAGLDLDCVSLGELATARHAGVDAARLHLHGNSKPAAELRQALAWEIGGIVVDSLDELRTLGALTADRATPFPVLLRLNPGIDVHTHAHIQTGQLDSKFGLPISTGMARAAVAALADYPGLRLVGLHAHLGSQITELDALAEGVRRLVAFAAAVRDEFGIVVATISPGGGLAVAYRADDPQASIADYAAALGETLRASCDEHGFPLPRLVIEPGRALIARSTVAVYGVVAVKAIADVRTYVAVDGGMGDNLRPALYEARYTVRPVLAAAGAAQPVTVAGRYCESGDVLARDVALPALQPGDLVAFAQAGAYTLSMASNYNLVPRPALVLVADGQVQLIQARETLDLLVARDTPLPAHLRGDHAA